MSANLFGGDERPGKRSAASDDLAPAARDAPLAERMRPITPEDVFGQTHLLGEGKLLQRILDGDITQSLILWGPPGVGKTTLARLVARASSARFVPFSAVLSGVKEMRVVMAEARAVRSSTGERTLLFVDEIHRFNKAQQDAFLPFVERGDVLLIGATTENPSFELNAALLSRCRVLILEPLEVDDIQRLLRHALESENGLNGRIQLSDEQVARIAHASDGDARRSLTLLETVAAVSLSGGAVDDAALSEALQRKQVRYDKSGEQHYDLISALHKSVRNSDENASLYWLARMLEGGEDRRYLSRRIVRIASEDIGLADPFALRISLDAAEAFDRLGVPEGDLALAQAVVYLARAAKSNAVYKGLARAREDVHRTANEPVPLHLRNAPTGLMKDAGYGKGYRYAHDDPAAKAEMECLPPSLRGTRYLDPPGGQKR
ncbi:Replication-associated recombination protein A [Planctomycetes bacterium Poly30]|uniref:Replication-associated recombination protein A n=1 Tax=Saltatorellus ferox TaxID=2528018 RepID=A0A518EZP2_9BACT|nr:Replication-associated recombination protein A [Planctomycetes bacterium Poly30]